MVMSDVNIRGSKVKLFVYIICFLHLDLAGISGSYTKKAYDFKPAIRRWWLQQMTQREKYQNSNPCFQWISGLRWKWSVLLSAALTRRYSTKPQSKQYITLHWEINCIILRLYFGRMGGWYNQQWGQEGIKYK